MRPEGGDLAFLWDMREQAVRLIKLLEGIDEAMFLSNEDVRLVAERRIEIIGEAASHVSSQLRSQHSEIPWRQIVGQRNILIHAYGEINSPARLGQCLSRRAGALADARRAHLTARRE